MRQTTSDQNHGFHAGGGGLRSLRALFAMFAVLSIVWPALLAVAVFSFKEKPVPFWAFAAGVGLEILLLIVAIGLYRQISMAKKQPPAPPRDPHNLY